jgi:hypothetical protein
MAFKKIDLSAADEQQPLDGFLTKRVEANNLAAYTGRAVVGSKTWVEPRPRYGCVNPHTFLPLAVPLSGRTKTVQLDWLLLAGGAADVYVAAVEFNPATRTCTPEGMGVDDPWATLVATSLSPAKVALTVEVSDEAMARGIAFLGLHILSDWDSATSTKQNYNSPHTVNILSVSDGLLLLDEPGVTGTPPWDPYDPDARYALQIIPHSSSTDQTAITPVLDVLQAYGTAGTNLRATVSPTIFYDDRNLGGDFAIDWREIGWVELWGVTAYEVVAAPAANLVLEPGYSPRVPSLGQLHADQLQTWKTSGAPRCISAQEDVQHTDSDGNQVNRHGAVVSINDQTWRPLGAAFLGSTVLGGAVDVDGSTLHRNRHRLVGLLAVGATKRISSQSFSAGEDMRVRVRVVTATWDAGTDTWTDNDETFSITDDACAFVDVGIQLPNYNHTGRGRELDYTDYIAWSYGSVLGAGTSYDPVHHNLRGTWPTRTMGLNLLPDEGQAFITTGGCGLGLFEMEFEDEHLDTEDRLARLEVRGDFYTLTARNRLKDAGVWAFVPCWTLVPVQEVA